MDVGKMSFNASCDMALDRITVELARADVTDPDEVKVLCENAKHLRMAKEHNRPWYVKIFSDISVNDLIKLAFSVGMYYTLRKWEDDGVVLTTRATGFIPWNRSPK